MRDTAHEAITKPLAKTATAMADRRFERAMDSAVSRSRREIPSPTFPPCVDLDGMCIHGPLLTVLQPVHRKAFLLFPPLDSADVALQVGRNLLPRVKT